MPKTKKLQSQISKKLDQLSKLLDNIDEARTINSNDSDTWDSDAIYNLVAVLKEALTLLEGQEHPKEKDEFGQSLILKEGLCTLVDEYHSENENENHD